MEDPLLLLPVPDTFRKKQIVQAGDLYYNCLKNSPAFKNRISQYQKEKINMDVKDILDDDVRDFTALMDLLFHFSHKSKEEAMNIARAEGCWTERDI